MASMGIAGLAFGTGLKFGRKAGAEESGNRREITHRVFFDVALCPLNTDQSRSVGENTVICSEPVSLGRLVIGLYGNTAPDSAANFLELATKDVGGYKGSIFQEIHRGKYIVGGRQGRVQRGYVAPTWNNANKDITNPKSLALRPDRPGSVSLTIKNGPEGGLGSEFAISTSPMPSAELDDSSIVIGEVIEGLPDVLDRIDQIPTFKPIGVFAQTEKTANLIGGVLGDQRAERARESWVKPKLTVLIQNAGMLS
eukprot:CAMPEP_0197526224 /NCGR_PEP_ID=MMETSP1318-20131121/16819_1 /TAXON_ID=552666 /ORGANISM="Partenskyella glossopodia, Strain RCC365" /LENGTH=253 /DNA_ID=CAMNT_0043080289 /DNA_START=82 /DNA_END=843 /DNA_ORIENTATION=-